MADGLADLDLQRLTAQRARRTTLAALAPRRPGEMRAAEPEPRLEARETSGAPFDGVYDGTFTSGTQTIGIRLALRRTGERVTGQYDYGAGLGRLDGLVVDGRLVFSWQEGNAKGRGELRPDPGGAITTVRRTAAPGPAAESSDRAVGTAR